MVRSTKSRGRVLVVALAALGVLCGWLALPVLGILLGAGLSTLVSLLTPLPSAVAPWSVFAGLALSVGTGLFFGIYPAYRASRLDPIDALRYE